MVLLMPPKLGHRDVMISVSLPHMQRCICLIKKNSNRFRFEYCSRRQTGKKGIMMHRAKEMSPSECYDFSFFSQKQHCNLQSKIIESGCCDFCFSSPYATLHLPHPPKKITSFSVWIMLSKTNRKKRDSWCIKQKKWVHQDIMSFLSFYSSGRAP